MISCMKMNIYIFTFYALGSSKDGQSWNTEEDHAIEVKELGRSKWSNEFDEDDTERTEIPKGNLNALSGLIRAYGKEAKSVRWGDWVCVMFVLDADCFSLLDFDDILGSTPYV